MLLMYSVVGRGGRICVGSKIMMVKRPVFFSTMNDKKQKRDLLYPLPRGSPRHSTTVSSGSTRATVTRGLGFTWIASYSRNRRILPISAPRPTLDREPDSCRRHREIIHPPRPYLAIWSIQSGGSRSPACLSPQPAVFM